MAAYGDFLKGLSVFCGEIVASFHFYKGNILNIILKIITLMIFIVPAIVFGFVTIIIAFLAFLLGWLPILNAILSMIAGVFNVITYVLFCLCNTFEMDDFRDTMRAIMN